MKSADGYVMVDAILALVVLLCGIVAAVQSFRATLRANDRRNMEYAAATRLEARVLEIEKSAEDSRPPDMDDRLGPLVWNQTVQDLNGSPAWRCVVALHWNEKGKTDGLQLDTILAR